MGLAYAAAQMSAWLALLFLPLTAGFLVRTFILMHDCSHGSFFTSRRANDAVGFITGVLTLTPFAQWRRDHALHHASSGDLDRRGHGDFPTLTIREYRAKSKLAQFGYRLVRHPLLLLLGGPVKLAIGQRLNGSATDPGSKQESSVVATNITILVMLALAIWAVGFKTVLVVYLAPYYFAAMFGVWLFYIQHQFEDAYWAPHKDWDYVDAALQGSSHLKMPAVLNWFTGDIGLHHVHHVAPRIPNYRLRQCHTDNALFHASPTVTIRSGMAALRLALWDEDRQRLVRFRDAHLS
jgi:omega-6 fatty acid desaturase (delta-12 desaturase)